MAEEMKPAGFLDGIDILLPIPLSKKRYWQRGYNQSEMLARGMSEVTGLPVITKAVRRTNFRQSQTSLTRKERQENVEGTFVLRHPELLENKHVLLIDDICTTGATLLACSEAIRSVKGIHISILTLGLTKK
jgi:ComF family protein